MSGRSEVHGPYATAAQAEEDAAHVYEAGRRERVRGTVDRINEGLLLAALGQAGVELGAFDRRIVGWLAGWEPGTVQVLLGWIERAGLGAPGEGACCGGREGEAR